MSKQLVMKFMLQLHKMPKWFRVEMRDGLGALENQAERTCTSHQVTFLNERNGDAGDAVENQRRSFLNEATAELQRHQKQSYEHLQDHQQGVRRHLSEVQQEVQVQRVASGVKL